MDAAAGGRLLVAVEESSLEEILTSLRTALDTATFTTSNNTTAESHSVATTSRNTFKPTTIAELDEVAAHHFRATQSATVSVTGRSLPLLYHVLSSLVSPPHRFAVLVIDLDGRFDPTRLTCQDSDTSHIYLQRPPRIVPYGDDNPPPAANSGSSPEQLRALVGKAEDFMLYGNHASAARPWWGTVVVGGVGAGDLVAAWKGWLRVDREAVQPFSPGTSAEEALARRSARQEVVNAAGWAATSQWGGFVFGNE